MPIRSNENDRQDRNNKLLFYLYVDGFRFYHHCLDLHLTVWLQLSALQVLI